MTTQGVTLRNVGPDPCILRTNDIRSAVLIGPTGRRIPVDLTLIKGDRLRLGTDRAGALDFGADGSSGDCGPIARSVAVRFVAAAPPVLMYGAWVALGCEVPHAIEVYRF